MTHASPGAATSPPPPAVPTGGLGLRCPPGSRTAAGETRRTVRRTFLLPCLLLLLPGCATLIDPSAAHVHRAQELRPGTTQNDLEGARSLLLETCAECHGVRSPRRYEPGEWEFAILRMLKGEAVEVEPDVVAAIALYLDVASALPNDRAVADYLAAHPELAGDPAPTVQERE